MNRTSFERVENLDSPERVEAFVQLANTKANKDNVVKVVIGPSPGSEVARRANASELDDVNENAADPRDAWRKTSIHGLDNIDWQSFSNLTHLYIWSISGLTKVGRLPEKLECLDLRGCAELKSLPDQLPKTLENLDLEGCVALEKLPDSLPNTLTEVYLGGCRQLKVFEPVRELITSQFRPVWDKPASSGGVTPSGIHRLELHGCIFNDLDRSLCGDAGENVIGYVSRFLKGIDKQGKALLPECKVVVLGDGGAGKTSLIRALKGLPFQKNEEATDKIRCWDWDDGVRNPFDTHENPTINVWDFAGQQLYHATHRMFLESRAVFIVVWRTPPKDGGPNRPECSDDVRHDLNYWLDQIYAANDSPTVILVRTRCDEDESNPPNAEWANKLRDAYKHFAKKSRFFEVSATDKGRETTLPKLKEALQEAIHEQMRSIGGNEVPAGWKDVREKLANRQPRWQDDASQLGTISTDPSPVMPLSDFKKFVEKCYQERTFPAPTGAEVRDILRYFHDIGAVYCPRRWRDQWQTIPQPQVIIDQLWAIATVYQLTAEPGVQALLRDDKGVVTRTMLSALWKKALIPNRESAQFVNRERAPEPCGSLPDNLWAIEQMMLTAGILVEVPMMLKGEQQFVFPDYLAEREDVENALMSGETMFKTLLLSPGHTFSITGLDGAPIPSEFDYSFAARMIAQSYEDTNDTKAFKYGVVTPVELRSDKLDGPCSLAMVIEWHPPLSTNGCGLTFTIYGDVPDDIDPGDIGCSWFSGWIERVRPGSVGRLSLSKEGGGSRRLADRSSNALSTHSVPAVPCIDVGISYANGTDPDHRKFIEALTMCLERHPTLQQGITKNHFTIYDYEANTHGYTTSGITDRVSGADIFIGVISHKYLASMTCMSELLEAARRHTCCPEVCVNITEDDIQTMVGGADGPPWGPQMRVVRLPSKKKNRACLSDFQCKTTKRGRVRKWFFIWPMKHRRDDDATAVWARRMSKEVDLVYENKKKMSPGIGDDELKKRFLKDPDGPWIVTTRNAGEEAIKIVRKCLVEQNYPLWNRVKPEDIDKRAEVLADDVAVIVGGLKDSLTVAYKMRHFAQEAAEAAQRSDNQRAIECFARLMALQKVDAQEVGRSSVSQLFEPETVDGIEDMLEAARESYVAQHAKVQRPGR